MAKLKRARKTATSAMQLQARDNANKRYHVNRVMMNAQTGMLEQATTTLYDLEQFEKGGEGYVHQLINGKIVTSRLVKEGANAGATESEGDAEKSA